MRELVRQRAGIALPPSKRPMICRRLRPRLQALGLDSFSEYVALLQRDPAEVELCLNAISTNLTAFFREPHHFEFLARQWAAGPPSRGQGRLRLWSAGCATGEEAYSIAMALGEVLAPQDFQRVLILATDINSEALAVARAGEYDLAAVRHLSEARLRRWFWKGKGRKSGRVQVYRELQERIRFRSLNLYDRWPMNRPFQAIFYRNVMIYFDRDTQIEILDRMSRLLMPGGLLFLGHSECLLGMSDRFRSVAKTTFERREAAPG
ncbi:MAG: protein-glutamate O-methyltransferase CheR [Armatimonadetes bacterium]|nr:protein-glutamate O-methyltransferase CheR [Armatimonadota bacterium]